MLRALLLAILALLAVAVFTLAAPPRHASLVSLQSTGCSPVRPHEPGSTGGSIATADGTRTFLLHVPASYNGADAVPLVLAFHGMLGSSTWMENYSGLSARADQPDGGFIVVYPQGLATWGITHFNNTLAPGPEPDDIGFATQLLDTLESQLCIDPHRVYATGFSNGAQMSVRTACSLSSRIAAVGFVAGAYYPPEWQGSAESCPGTRPVPVIAFHGTADTVIPFTGGGALAVRLPIDNATPAEDVMADWAAHDGCDSTRHVSVMNSDVQLVEYGGCAAGALVQLYVTNGGGHVWPGAGGLVPPDGAVDATELIWQFFRSHPADGAPLPDGDGDGTPDMYDTDNDNDGCTDLAELQTGPGSEVRGGRRDLNNPWDYFNPTGDGRNRADDIMAVARHYHFSATTPGYSTRYDRSFIGPDPWDLGPPDGIIRMEDILALVKQLFHDCV